jgi:hypothetical protein
MLIGHGSSGKFDALLPAYTAPSERRKFAGGVARVVRGECYKKVTAVPPPLIA